MPSAAGARAAISAFAKACSTRWSISCKNCTTCTAARFPWSAGVLGGLYARQLAKMMPERVRSVITLGSPFAAGPKATNAWRVYEMASGRRADEEDARFGGSLAGAPPVPTTAIFSRTDGICAWQGCREEASAMSESIEVESSHCGMGHHPAAVYAVADRLAQPEGEWAPFGRSGWRSLVYPDPHR